MRRNRFPKALGVFLLSLGVGSSAGASGIRLEAGPHFVTHFSFSVRTWTLKKDGSPDLRVTEVSSPLLLRRPIGRGGEVSVYLAGSSASSDGEKDSDFNGFNDMEISGSYRFGAGRYWLGGGMSLPTGEAEIEKDRQIIAGIVSNRILGLRVKRFGEGFDFFLSGARAFSLSGGAVASAGMGYRYKGEYGFQQTGNEPVRLKPGNELFVAAGVEGELPWPARGLTWRGDVRYRAFGKDERNGEEVYEEGDQAEFLGWVGFPFTEDRTVDMQLLVVFKGKGSRVDGIGEGSIDSLSLEEYLLQSLPGGVQQLSLQYGQRLSDRIELTAHTIYSHYGEYSSRGEEPQERLLGSAGVFDFGGGLRYFLSVRCPISLRFSFLAGNAEGGAVDLTGFDFTAVLQWTY